MIYLVALLLSPFQTVLSGWVFCKLWAWFVVPVFALPPLTAPQAIGFMLVVAHLTHQRPKAIKDKEEAQDDVLGGIAFDFIKPAFCLGVGAIVKLFL